MALEKSLRFQSGKADILVCSTIIESGWICQCQYFDHQSADRFGLTQLHQLRGRVGRGATLAYAYLLFDKASD